jgi:hypothetical protein
LQSFGVIVSIFSSIWCVRFAIRQSRRVATVLHALQLQHNVFLADRQPSILRSAMRLPRALITVGALEHSKGEGETKGVVTHCFCISASLLP